MRLERDDEGVVCGVEMDDVVGECLAVTFLESDSYSYAGAPVNNHEIGVH